MSRFVTRALLLSVNTLSPLSRYAFILCSDVSLYLLGIVTSLSAVFRRPEPFRPQHLGNIAWAMAETVDSATAREQPAVVSPNKQPVLPRESKIVFPRS